MKVSQLMTTHPKIIPAGETVLRAAETLARSNIGTLPVEKDDRLIGMLTDRDIVVRVVAAGHDPAKTKVEDVISPQVKYCFEDEDVDHVRQNMQELRVRRLPVVNRDKRLVGVISLDDISTRH
jgi:CBS domain-containing protein